MTSSARPPLGGDPLGDAGPRLGPSARVPRGFPWWSEVIVIVVVLGLLIVFVGAQGGNKASGANREDGQGTAHTRFGATRDTARMQLRNFSQSIDTHKARNRSLPKSLDELTQPDPSTGEPFIDSIPLDPWGQAYDYRIVDERGNRYDIRSGGDDKILDTEDDVIYPEPEGQGPR